MKTRIALVLAAILFAYGFFVEADWIETTHHSFPTAVGKPVKIAHLTDIHTRGFGRREKRVLKILEQEKPDVIVITGDTVSRGHHAYERAHAFLEKLRAPMGVYLVHGNWENRRPHPNDREFYRSAGVTLLDNESVLLAGTVWLVGVDDSGLGRPNWAKAIRDIPPEAAKLALFHSPAFFDAINGNVALALAGHTHGGQIRVPFLPAFYLPRASNRYTAGWYGRRGSALFVCRGIGNSGLPIRLACRPELAFITLTNREASSL